MVKKNRLGKTEWQKFTQTQYLPQPSLGNRKNTDANEGWQDIDKSWQDIDKVRDHVEVY